MKANLAEEYTPCTCPDSCTEDLCEGKCGCEGHRQLATDGKYGFLGED